MDINPFDTKGHPVTSAFGRLGAMFAATAAIIFLPFLFYRVFMGGSGHWPNTYRLFLERQLYGNIVWFWVIIWAIVVAAVFWYASDTVSNDKRDAKRQDRHYYRSNRKRNLGENIALGIAWAFIVLSVVAVFMLFRGFRYYDIDRADYWLENTEFVIEDTSDVPESLRFLVDRGADISDSFIAPVHYPTAPAVVGQYNDLGWQERGTSALGATVIIRETSGAEPGTEVLNNTLAYINLPLEEGQDPSEGLGYWTMVRDGEGITKPLDGIVVWDGRSIDEVQECRFDGQYEINRSLRGQRSNSLNHFIFERYPNLKYKGHDVYGYCDGDEPIVVIPMRRQVDVGYAVIDEYAGSLIVRGSPDGTPKLELLEEIEPGEILGPVYPIGLAAEQRRQHVWAAGRENHDRNSFGYEPADFFSQEGNESEYLLRSLEDGRSYWVTPLTLRGSGSQLVLAYMVIAADESRAGELNKAQIFVLDEDDDRVAIINQLELATREFVSEVRSDFIPSDGSFQEFIPSAGGTWTAVGVLEGRPVFVLRINPQTQRIQLENTTTAGFVGVVLGNDISGLDAQDLLQQLELVADEIKRRGVQE